MAAYLGSISPWRSDSAGSASQQAQFKFAITADQRLARPRPGLQANHPARGLGPDDRQVQRWLVLQLHVRSSAVIDQGDRTGRPRQEITPWSSRVN